jgi:hypothetical protein
MQRMAPGSGSGSGRKRKRTRDGDDTILIDDFLNDPDEIRRQMMIEQELEFKKAFEDDNRWRPSQQPQPRKKKKTPLRLLPEPPVGQKGSISIKIRYPSGSQGQRRFLPTSSVEDLYTWADSLDPSPTTTAATRLWQPHCHFSPAFIPEDSHIPRSTGNRASLRDIGLTENTVFHIKTSTI